MIMIVSDLTLLYNELVDRKTMTKNKRDIPWHTDGVVKTVVPQHVHELRQSATRAHDAEQRQCTVPYHQSPPQLKSRNKNTKINKSVPG